MRAQLAAFRMLYPIVSHKLRLARAKLERRAVEQRRLVEVAEEHRNARLAWETTWHKKSADAWAQGWNAATTHALPQCANEIEDALRDFLPPSFFCPILGELLRDPVITVEDGHTYERTSISTWLKRRDTAPMTGVALTSTRLACNHALRNGIHEILLKCARTSKGILAVWAIDQMQKHEQERATNSIMQLHARHGAAPDANQVQGLSPADNRDDLARTTGAPAPAGAVDSARGATRTQPHRWLRILMEATLVCLAFAYSLGIGMLVSMGSYVCCAVLATLLRPCPEYKLPTSATCRGMTSEWALYAAVGLLCPMHLCGLVAWAVGRPCGNCPRARVSTSMLLGWAMGCSVGLLLILPGAQRDPTDVVMWVRYRENVIVRSP